MMKKALILALCLTAWTSAVSGDNWPQYLGPNRNATSPETGLLKSWPESGPEALWIFPLGEGYGAPAVYEGKVYILDKADKKDTLRCLDLATGKEEWSYSYDASGSYGHPGSRSVPTVDKERIYTCGPDGDIYCIDKTTHKPIWNKSLREGFGNPASLGWGFGQNPLLYKNMLIVAPMTNEVGVAALDPSNGNIIWKSAPLPGNPSYVSPAIFSVGGMEQVVMASATNERRGRRRGGSSDQQTESQPSPEANKGAIVGLDPKNGQQLWSYNGWQCMIPIPNVVAIGGDRFFITGGYRAGSAIFRVSQKDGAYVAEEVLKTQDFGTHCHPPLFYKNHLYGICSTNETRDGLVCMNLEGKVQWKTESNPFFDKGGMILADEMIISVDGRDGFLYLIDPAPEGFKPLAKAKMLEPGESWAPLTLVDGKLLIRDQTQIKCVKIK
ncbi:MAG: PQQ-binding-like beta-propeller repeat protein [Candidatus Omnitrophota bacterium]